MNAKDLIGQYKNGKRNFSDADLSGANLRWADLRWADLSGAIGNGREIKTLLASRYHITWTADVMAIGCEQYPIAEWWEFSDERIDKMDNGALEWRREWKTILQQLVEQCPQE